MPVTINGTSGVTTPGLASTAMPTSGGDPVAESGSNSDGDWTKWADGTQIVRSTVSPDWTFVGNVVFPYPLVFIDVPAGETAGVKTGDNDAVTNYQSITAAGAVGLTQWFMRTDGTGVNGTGDPYKLSFYAIGRWK